MTEANPDEQNPVDVDFDSLLLSGESVTLTLLVVAEKESKQMSENSLEKQEDEKHIYIPMSAASDEDPPDSWYPRETPSKI